MVATLWYELPCEPEVPILGIYSKEMKTLSQRIFVIASSLQRYSREPLRKQAKCPSVGERIKKMWSICTMEYVSATRKKETLSFTAKHMKLQDIMLSEISQTKKSKYNLQVKSFFLSQTYRNKEQNVFARVWEVWKIEKNW